MKKFVLSLLAPLAATLALVSCADDAPNVSNGQEVQVSYRVSLPSNLATRAYGEASQVKTLYYAVYATGTTDALLSGQVYNAFSATDLVEDLELTLVTGKSYDLIFWADSSTETEPGMYTFDAASQSISANYSDKPNFDEKADAFFGKVENMRITGTLDNPVYLRRPFAQLNIGTDDLPLVRPAVSSVSVTVPVYQKLNLFSGQVSDQTEVTFGPTDFTTITEAFPVASADSERPYKYLAMDYLLVDDRELVKVTMSTDDPTVNPYVYDNVPVQRNYKTNIFGSLLTSLVNYQVTIVPDFDGVSNVEVIEASSIDDMNAALAALNPIVTEVIFKMAAPLSGNQTFSVPAATTVNQISLEFDEVASGASLSIPTTDFSGSIIITTPGGGNPLNLNVDAPKAHVVLHGLFNVVAATTSQSTLVVSADATVSELVIGGGNVEIYGNVDKVDKDTQNTESPVVTVYPGATVGSIGSGISQETVIEEGLVYAPDSKTYSVSTPEGLVALSSIDIKGKEKVVLTADIDLSGVAFSGLKAWNPETPNTFDGQGHTVSNWTNTDGNSDMGFIKSWVGPVKNVTLKNVTLKTNGRSAVVAAKIYGNIENCHVINCSITDSYWATGLIAGLYNSGNISNCTVTASSLTSNGGIGGIVGVINETKSGTRNISDCSVTDCVLYRTGIYGDVYGGGEICGMVNVENSTVVLENCFASGNTLTNITGLLGCDAGTGNTITVNGTPFK